MSQSINYLYPSFSHGIMSPKTSGRVDIPQYKTACSVLDNFIPAPQGCIERRPSTRYINSVKYHDKNTVIVPFIFAQTQAYILEFGHLYIRIYKQEGIVTSSGSPVEITTTYTEDEISTLYFTQNANDLYITHIDHKPRLLTRTSDISWSIADLVFEDGPYLEINASPTTVTPSAKTGSITITASDPIFASTDVGRMIRIYHTGKWGYATITGFTSTTLVSATVAENYPFEDTVATDGWRLSAWSNTLGYPAVCTFHEQRLFFGKTKTYPQDFWASVSTEFTRFSPTKRSGTGDDAITDDSAFSYRLVNDSVNIITWMKSSRVLCIGCNDSEFRIQASSTGEALTPTNVKAERQTNQGGLQHIPALVNQDILFLHRTGNRMYKYAFDVESNYDLYNVEDLTVYAESILRDHRGGKQIVFCGYPNQTAFVVCNDGQLLALTYFREQKVLSWSTQTIAGNRAKVLHLASIPSTNADFDQLWLIVERVINGNTVRYIETMQDYFYPENDEDKEFCTYVDSMITYADPKTITNVSNSNPCVITATAHGYNNGDTVRILNIDGISDINHKDFIVRNKTTNTFEIDMDTSSNTTYIEGGNCYKHAKTIGGLSHLEGETVSVLVDGSTHPDVIVNSGTINLTRGGGIVQIGLSYSSRVVLLPIELYDGTNTFFLANKSSSEIGVRLLNTLCDISMGWHGHQLDSIPFRSSSDSMGNSPRLQTNLFSINKTMTPERIRSIEILAKQPLPCTILNIMLKLKIDQ